MKVQELFKQYSSVDDIIKVLHEKHNVDTKLYKNHNLMMLNYDFYNRKKNDDIHNECRSLLLDTSGNIISRSFDVFGMSRNIKDIPNISDYIYHEKYDGTMISVYHHNGNWYCSTRSTAFAEYSLQTDHVSITAVIYNLLKVYSIREFTEFLNNLNFNKDCTYIFELISPYHVTKYDKKDIIYLISRNKKTGEFINHENELKSHFTVSKKYYFKTHDDIENAMNNFANFEEGYVAYIGNTPQFKIKDKKWSEMFYLKGEGLSKPKILKIYISNEVEDYISVYPDTKDMFNDILSFEQNVIKESQQIMDEIINDNLSRKEIALLLKSYKYDFLIFSMLDKGLIDVNEYYYKNLSPENRMFFLKRNYIFEERYEKLMLEYLEKKIHQESMMNKEPKQHFKKVIE